MNLSVLDQQIIPQLFSNKEKQSIYQVMCAVRKIGAHHMVEKENVIHEVMQVTKITPSDQVQSRLLNQQQMISILTAMDEIKKMYFAKFISLVALEGGNTQNETLFVNWITNEIGVPDIN